MSSLPPLALPRFHVNALKPTHKDPKAPINPGGSDPAERQEDAFEAPGDQADGAHDADLQLMPEAPAAALLPEVDTGAILERLESALNGIEQSAFAHSQQLVSDFLGAAFPNLCDVLLAEEITASIDAMAPNAVERLHLTVPAAFESAFQRTLQSSPKMAERCELSVRANSEEIIVDVDWQSGGLNFDMDAFLKSSLGRLTGQTFTQEGQDV